MRVDLRRFALLAAVSTAVVALGTACGGSDSSDSVSGCDIQPATSCQGADLGRRGERNRVLRMIGRNSWQT